jgi:internalin A
LTKARYSSIYENVDRIIEEAQQQGRTQLDLSGWRLSHFPIALFKLSQLTQLSLANNRLAVVPAQITWLRKLKALDLSGNPLHDLGLTPISRLTELQRLSLANTGVEHLPDELESLINLESLDLSGNSFAHFPKQLLALRSLKSLDLSKQEGNVIRHLPAEITKLNSLKELSVDAATIKSPPPEVAQRGAAAIFNYFRERQTQEDDFLYEAKLLIVGEERVGKTSLMKSLTNPSFSLDEHEKSTEGINIETLTLSKEEIGLAKDFRLNVWDFGGQEIYHSTHQFFLTKRSLYLLVTEPRREVRHDDFYYWLSVIKLLGHESPVLLVQNKCDQPLEDIPVAEYKRRFDNIVEDENLIRTSCQGGRKDTIEQLKRVVVRTVKNTKLFPHIGEPLPKVWTSIREEVFKLQERGLPYIAYSEYEAVCERYGMDTERAAFLADYLHDLGVILHYSNDPLLKRTIFLNSEWVTQGVYKVLDDAATIERYGEFSAGDFERLWRGTEYVKMTAEFLSLMRQFKICYPLANQHYLAPQRLPKDELSFHWRSDEVNLKFEYRYAFMPKGILTRFIVERHRDVYERTHWRYGVLLDVEGTRVLVREDYFQRKITIKVEGANARDVLAEVRATFRKLHGEFNSLDVQEMVPCACRVCLTNDMPHFYEYQRLVTRRGRGKSSIPCEKSEDDVQIGLLLDAVIPPAEQQEVESKNTLKIHYNPVQFMTRIENAQGVAVGDASINGGTFGQTNATVRKQVDSELLGFVDITPTADVRKRYGNGTFTQ